MNDNHPHYLKCHACNKRLTLIEQSANIKIYECPNAHSKVAWVGNQIHFYHLFWDANEDGSERYRLDAGNAQTKLYIKGKQSRYNPFMEIISIDKVLPLEIKDNTIQLNNIVPRLKKLKAFT